LGSWHSFAYEENRLQEVTACTLQGYYNWYSGLVKFSDQPLKSGNMDDDPGSDLPKRRLNEILENLAKQGISQAA
jgi:hypothetical protein